MAIERIRKTVKGVVESKWNPLYETDFEHLFRINSRQLNGVLTREGETVDPMMLGLLTMKHSGAIRPLILQGRSIESLPREYQRRVREAAWLKTPFTGTYHIENDDPGETTVSVRFDDEKAFEYMEKNKKSSHKRIQQSPKPFLMHYTGDRITTTRWDDAKTQLDNGIARFTFKVETQEPIAIFVHTRAQSKETYDERYVHLNLLLYSGDINKDLDLPWDI